MKGKNKCKSKSNETNKTLENCLRNAELLVYSNTFMYSTIWTISMRLVAHFWIKSLQIFHGAISLIAASQQRF